MTAIRRILFPTDFSEQSKAAERFACELADQFQAQLHVISVLEDAYFLAPEPSSMLMLPPNLFAEAQRQIEESVANVPPEAWSRGKQVIRTTRIGSAYSEIVKYANEHKIDLIVIGTHGRTGLMHVLLGSVAERVVRHAPCAVLTVRGNAAAS